MADCRRFAVWQYMLVMIPAGLLFLICYLFFCRLIIKPNMAPMHNMNVDELCEHLTTIAQQTCVVWKHLETAEEDF